MDSGPHCMCNIHSLFFQLNSSSECVYNMYEFALISFAYLLKPIKCSSTYLLVSFHQGFITNYAASENFQTVSMCNSITFRDYIAIKTNTNAGSELRMAFTLNCENVAQQRYGCTNKMQ